MRKLLEIVTRHDDKGKVSFTICDPIGKRFKTIPNKQIEQTRELLGIAQFDTHYSNVISVLHERSKNPRGNIKWREKL